MSSEFSPLLWFVCKICRQAFPDPEKLKNHKIRKHAEVCKNVKCVVFEERLFGKQWIPSNNYFPEADTEFTKENVIEVIPVTFKCGCHCHSNSSSVVPLEAETVSYQEPPKASVQKPNPYVLVKRLTLEELNAALISRNEEKATFQSSRGSEENKRTYTDGNHDNVQLSNKKKKYVKNQQNQNQEQNSYADVNPEVFPEITTSSVKPSRNVFPEQVVCSSFPPVIDPSGNALPRANRSKSKFNHPESHICPYCSLDCCNSNYLRDHQRLCTKKNSVSTSDNKNNGASANRGHANGENLDIQIDKTEVDSEPHSSKTSTPSRKVNLISSSTNVRSKIKKVICSVTDTDGESDLPAPKLDDVSEIKNDNFIESVAVPRKTLRKRDSTATSLQDLKFNSKKKKKKNLALLEWLETQKETFFPDGTPNKICLFIERFVASQRLGVNNYITCRLCETKLKTELQVMNHVTNCWVHNQINHCYCVPCSRRFGSPQNLANHFQKEMFTAKHDCFRRSNGPHVLEEVNTQEVGVEEDLLPTDLVASADDLPLPQWLKIQHKNPDNVVALEPDPFVSSRNFPNATFTISESSPIKCKLCLQFLTSDLLLRIHVETCWLQNKAKHRYCVLCNKTFNSHLLLRRHQRRKHRNVAFQKQKQESSWSCTVCHKDMENEHSFNAHQESLRIFLGKDSETESKDFACDRKANVESPPAQCVNIPDQEGTMMSLSRWLKYIRKLPNSDGTVNLVLVDPDPGSSGHLGEDGDNIEINEENPITCRLCLKKFTEVDDVKNHVMMCWSQNKDNHRYCATCEKGFATPTELQEHKTSEHSAPKNIILFCRESDGDRSLLNLDGLEVNSDNPVTCKLCETELTSTPEVKIHSDNCWVHNKGSHMYCTFCDRRFDDPVKLRLHLNRFHPRPETAETSGQSHYENNNENNEIELENNMPLRQWLSIQKQDPKNIFALEPDPLAPKTAAVSESSPIKCKLCKIYFTTDAALKAHVTTCWLHNKAKHSYCVICDSSFRSNYLLLRHNAAKHPKCLTNLLICSKCNHEFLTESELTKHTESLEEFYRQRKYYAVPPSKKVNSVAFLCEWLKHLRQRKNLDGTENIILVDPEPTADNFDEINTENPISCRLCRKKFTTATGVRCHVRDCWAHKKALHRFCVICEKAFETPQNLQEHSKMEHSDGVTGSFICKFCRQQFSDMIVFKKHQELHKDSKFPPFKCRHCFLI